MAIQIVWAAVNLGPDPNGPKNEDGILTGDPVIAHRGATLPSDVLSDYDREALSVVGAIKIVDDALLGSTKKGATLEEQAQTASDPVEVARMRVAEAEAALKEAEDAADAREAAEAAAEKERAKSSGSTSGSTPAPAKSTTPSSPAKAAPAKAAGSKS